MITQLDRDLNAAVEFLAEDPRRFLRALAVHWPRRNGWCTSCALVRWPCLTHRLAEHAQALHRDRRIPSPRLASP